MKAGIAQLETLCGCRRQVAIGYPVRWLEIPIERPVTVWEPPEPREPRTRRFELRSCEDIGGERIYRYREMWEE